MAKTIEDIIEAKTSEMYAMGCGQTYIDAIGDGIRFGANAVLEKIEGHLNRVSVDTHSNDDLEDLYDTLCEMVKNLKEE